MRWPSGEKAALTTVPEWPSSLLSSWPLAAFQTRAVSSRLAVTMRWPSGEKAALSTGAEWPSSLLSLTFSREGPAMLIIERLGHRVAASGREGTRADKADALL